MLKLILALSLISISKSSKNVKNHDKCVGLRYFKERRVDLAVKHLLRSDTQNDEDTAIALAASFSMMARRLSTIEGEEEMERNALRSAVEYFEIAERRSSKKMKIECSEDKIVRDAEQIVRSHGDALAWLGKRTKARELFERSGLWSNPTCRPRTKYPEAPNLEYIINDHVIITRLLPLLPFLREMTEPDRILTNRNDLLSRGWTSETAGLHRGKRRWWMRFLFVNGKEQEPTYPFLMNLVQRIPALNLRQGQIKLSLMRPGTSVRPHAGPTNGRLRVHCLLHNDMKSNSYIRVGTKIKHWNDMENPCFVFRESCEHEVYIDANATSNRIILIADFANPYLTSFESYLSVLNGNVDASAVRKEYEQQQHYRDNNEL